MRPPDERSLGRIVVAYDGSDCARAAFDFAVRLGGTVTIVEVMESPYDALKRASEPVPGLDEVLEREEEARTEGLVALAATATSGASVSVELLQGPTSRTLTAFLSRIDADLVVAGTHGMGLTRYLLGSVSQRLLEEAPCDVLLFREPEVPARDPQVIAAIDGSPAARRAVAVAGELATVLSSPLVITHVADSRLPLAHTPYAAVRQMIRQRGIELIAEAREQVDLPPDAVSDELREGDPRKELLEACRERSPAVLVLGHRGAGRLRSALMGSTAREAAHRARCPVLVVRADDASEEGVR